jgi:hypothetical protein
VQEYIAADGRLFAITWTGPQSVPPRAVVGQFFAQAGLGGAASAPRAQVVVHSVRKSWGSEGVAYMPSRMPMDFDPNGLAP